MADRAGPTSAATLGRELAEGDIEPVNWVQAEIAAKMSAVDYAAAVSCLLRLPPRAAGVVDRRLGPAADADAGRAAAD